MTNTDERDNLGKVIAELDDFIARTGSGFFYTVHLAQLKNMRDTLLTLQAPIAVTDEYVKDAEEYGNALNESAWEFIQKWDNDKFGVMPAILFNNCKVLLRYVILKYVREVNKAALAQPKGAQDDVP